MAKKSSQSSSQAKTRGSRSKKKATSMGARARSKAEVAANLAPEFRATAAGCLNQLVAARLVYSCTGTAGPVPAETKLGDLFPSDVQRRGFCGCVFNKAVRAGGAVTPSDIPCGASNTIGDVINAIAC